MNLKATLIAVIVAASLGACASPGTRVTTDSDFYKMSANSQQAWCSQVKCDCSINGQPATCSLAYTCMSAGSCKTQ